MELSEQHQSSLAKSFIMSVDMAHAVHPNYASKHEKAHSPLMNHGVVIKTNNNQRYATSGISGFIVRELARGDGGPPSRPPSTNSSAYVTNVIPIQEFAVRNDCPCGSTIGPVLSANTGIRAVDLGMPQVGSLFSSIPFLSHLPSCSFAYFAHVQLSMHSIREMMGVSDLTFATRLFETFFLNFDELNREMMGKSDKGISE